MQNINEQIDFEIINPNQQENINNSNSSNNFIQTNESNESNPIQSNESNPIQSNESNSIQSSNSDVNPFDNLNKIFVGANPDLVYNLILDELYDIISDNKNLFSKQNYVISKPDVIFENKKTIWINFKKNCEQINRTTYQVQKYITKELTAETSINEKGQLIIRGRYDPINLIKQFKSYIKNFVECSACKSFNTEIYRNSSNRMDYLKCLNEKPKCNYSKVVIKI